MRDVTQELEHLIKLAKEDPGKRFDRLYRLLRQGGLLAIAKERIASNKGAKTPGVDGQTIADVNTEGIVRLCEELNTGSYQPQPARRVYIPKRNGKLRPLGIPTSRDRIVQAGVALILEAIYEPIFRKCSHGFRRNHSTITALRQISTAYHAGAKWIIEGDISDCFGSIPHRVILNCLRKRIKDERFIDLIRKMLQAGIMEMGRYSPGYSGTPQGGIASPILANIVLNELDTWLEEQGINPPPMTTTELNARRNPEYMRLHNSIMNIRRYLDGKRPTAKKYTPKTLRTELREKLKQRSLQPSYLPRKAIYYTRYADDFVMILCNSTKEEAKAWRAKLAEWMKLNLSLTLNQEKTHVTHGGNKIRFLGYEMEGRRNRNGTGWMHLNVPKDAVRKIGEKIQQATRFPQAPEFDVFHNINAVARGWTNYYRYAHDNSVVGGKLSMVIYWCVAHYLGSRHRCSIAKIMHNHYARDPNTGCLGLYIYRPGKAETPENRYFLWHKTQPRLQLGSNLAYQVEDRPLFFNTDWATGRSQQKKLETREKAEKHCESCGATQVTLYVHHPNRLVNAKRIKKGKGSVAQSGLEQEVFLLCHPCHMFYHHHVSH